MTEGNSYHLVAILRQGWQFCARALPNGKSYLLLHWITAIFSLGAYQADEHFQILEFLNYFRGLNPPDAMPWEFHAQMRPWIQPLAFLQVIRVLEFFGVQNPIAQETTLRILVSTLGWLSSLLLAKAVTKHFQKSGRASSTYPLVLLGAWFVPFMHARISSEAVGASLFWIGFSIHMLWPARAGWVGLLMGLAFYTRFQIGIMIGAWWIWEWFWQPRGSPLEKKVLWTFFAAVALGVVCDRIGYGSWVLSPLHYFQQNLMEGKLAGFGRLPWWVFFKFMILSLPPLSLVAVVLAGWGIWRAVKSRDPLLMRLLVITIPFFVVHSMLAWKELRFLFPILPALLVFAVVAGQQAASVWGGRGWFRFAVNAGVVLNFCALIVFAMKPAFHRVPLFRELLKLEGNAVMLTFDGSGDPYGGPGQGLSYRFYQNPRLNWTSASSRAELDSVLAAQPAWVYSMMCPPPAELAQRLEQCSMVYQRFPSWMQNFNFNAWMERAPCDRVYRCD